MSELHDPQLRDHDPIETREWMDSLDSVLQYAGEARAEYLLKRVLEHARHRDIAPSGPLLTDFVNTIHPSEEPEFPGDAELEKRLRLIIRWNAAVMVHRANEHFPGLGGHISTYASVAKLFERRPGVHPGPLRAGHLRPRLPRGPLSEEQLYASARRSTARACRPIRTPG
jgi:pyruvate dehydrogenase complex dehydrogenase (E1) component